MFTGIVAGTGTVIAVQPSAHGTTEGTTRIRIQAGEIVQDLPVGGSLAVDGVCLTGGTDRPADGVFEADVMGETLARTTLGELAAGAVVNLERCLPADGRLDGHVVQGHVDATGQIVARTNHSDWEVVRIGVPADLAALLAEKGAIAVDGVSLTVTAVSAPEATEHWFEIGLIPATLAATGLGTKTTGARVNLEADVMAKYAARLAAFQPWTAPRNGETR